MNSAGLTAIEVDVSPTEIVYADPKAIERVLVTLLRNAVKFTPDGGEVSVGAQAFDDQIYIYVEDSGPGIAAADLRIEQAAVGGEGVGECRAFRAQPPGIGRMIDVARQRPVSADAQPATDAAMTSCFVSSPFCVVPRRKEFSSDEE